MIRGLLWTEKCLNRHYEWGKQGFHLYLHRLCFFFVFFFSFSFGKAFHFVCSPLSKLNKLCALWHPLHQLHYRGKMKASRRKNCISDCSPRLNLSESPEMKTNWVKCFIEIDWTQTSLTTIWIHLSKCVSHQLRKKKKLNEQYKFQTKYNTKGEILLNTIFQQQKNCVELELKES